MTPLGMRGFVDETGWKDFSTNRNEALRASEKLHRMTRDDYHLVIDADDVLDLTPSLVHDGLDVEYFRQEIQQRGSDGYTLSILHDNITYTRPILLRGDGTFIYQSPVHEFVSKPDGEITHLNWPVYRYLSGGDRSKQGDKYLRDAEVFEKAIKDDPTSPLIPRWKFYLAQSYRDAGEQEKALKAYIRCYKANGWIQERYICCIRVAEICSQREERGKAEGWLETAFDLIPRRIDAPFLLAKQLWDRNYRKQQALPWAVYAASLTPRPHDLFAVPEMHEWAKNLAVMIVSNSWD
jgi:tetratricopeptide (TPR) repeat protein